MPPQTTTTTDTPNSTDTQTSAALDDGDWYANLSTVDKAGNWTSTAHKGPFKIDQNKPTASLKIDGGAAHTNLRRVTLNISAADPGGSGPWMMRVLNRGAAWSTWEAFATSKSWELSAAAAASGPADGNRVVELEVKDRAYNHAEVVSDAINLDTQKPVVKMVTPFISTKISKTTTFKVKWSATDASPSSGVKSYTVLYRPHTSSTWRTWKSNTTAKQANFTGKAGVTYNFRTYAVDNAGNKGWSRVYKTIVPFNEGMSLLGRIGFNGYQKLASVRYSYVRGHGLVYKLHNTDGIGLIITKGPNMGKAKIYVDGKHVKTIDAYAPTTTARQRVFYTSFATKGTHFLKVVPGRAKFAVDAVAVKR